MTKFEQIGINHQYNSNSISEANKAFNNSCNCCCNKGMHIDCNKCAIAYTHALVCAIFNDIKEK